MADFPQFRDYFRIARDEMLARNSKLTLDAIERQGTDANAFAAAGAAVGDELTGQLARTEKAVYLDSAEDKELDRLVFDRYGITRKPASPALGSVEFTLTTPAAASFTIPVNTKLSTADGRQFLTTSSGTFLFGSVGPISVQVRSALAGLSQQARANTITSIVDPIVGAPSDLAVNNSLATAGADDAELDDSLRDRARRFFLNARRGTLAAIELAAVETPGVRRASAFEAIDEFGRQCKMVQLVVADAFTEQLVAVSPTPAAYQTQSQVLANAVFQGLSNTRPAGIYVDVKVAEVSLLGVILALSFHSDVDVDQVALRARAAVVAYINGLVPNAPFLRADAIARLRSVAGLYITENEIYSPAGDVYPQTLQVLRSTLGLVVSNTIAPESVI